MSSFPSHFSLHDRSKMADQLPNLPGVGQVEIVVSSNGGLLIPEPQIEVETTIIEHGLTETETVLDASGVQLAASLLGQPVVAGEPEEMVYVAANVGNDIEVDGVDAIEETEKDDQPSKKRKELVENKKKSVRTPKKAPFASRKVAAPPTSLGQLDTSETGFDVDVKVSSQQWDPTMVNVQIKTLDGNFGVGQLWPPGE